MLFDQANSWCEQHESPILVPLTSWLESPEKLLITRFDHPTGVHKLAITSFNQHIFFTNVCMEICMYHIPSKKLVKKFIGHTDLINSLQISSSNAFLVSGSSDKTLRIWNLGTRISENILK